MSSHRTNGVAMKQIGSMDFAELIALREKVEAALESRIRQERKRLTRSLQELDAVAVRGARKQKTQRANGHRKGAAVKYRNPENRNETWAGRGSRPRWLVAALKGGKKKLADFAVS